MAQNVATYTVELPARPALPRRIWWEISDTLTMVWRNLIYYQRQPQLIFFALVQPIIFVVLFSQVFGGAIQTGGDYINYLLPGILLQTMIFGASQTAVGLSDDLSKGMIDRFRSLPMSRAAVLMGRTIADSARGVFSGLVMIGVGTLLGFRFGDGLLNAALGMVILTLFGYAFTWVAANIGLLVKNPEAAQVASFLPVFPLVFASSIFVPPATMSAALRTFAENQPITVIANTVRALFQGGATTEMVVSSLAWTALILVIFMPIAVWQYRRVE